jgi:hypothetical protein
MREEAQKLDDFGEPIYGAPKHWKDYGMRVEDFAGLDQRQQAAYTKKAKIWPLPDYRAMVKEGCPREVAFFVKKVRDSIPVQPRTTDPDEMGKYLVFVAGVRDAVRELKTVDDIRNFGKFWEQNGYLIRNGYSLNATDKGCYLSDTIYQTTQIGEDHSWNWMKFQRSLSHHKEFGVVRTDEERAMDEYSIKKLDGSVCKLYCDDPSKDIMDCRMTVAVQSPLGTCYVRANPDDHILNRDAVQGSYFILRNNYRIVGVNYQTESDAKKRAVEIYLKEKPENGGTKKKNFVLASLEHIERIGPKIRTKDAVPDMFLELGFRGGEFGNWVTDEERHWNFNEAYDAFRDVTDALGIAPTDVSLGGHLAIAFGSRGHGSALAHYETVENIINLTRKKGAGSLGHEFGHAMDAYVASETLNTTGFMSHCYNNSACNKHNIRNAYEKLMTDMFQKGDGEQTNYYKESLSMDTEYRRCGFGYWGSSVEMFARAFACYLKDKLWDCGRQNDYLCGHADMNGHGIPKGEERKLLNKDFDALIQTMIEAGLFHANN